MIFINEALFTVCFLRVLRVLVTVFALGLLKQLSLCSVLRPRKGGDTWSLSLGLGLPRGLDQTFCILNKEGFLCSTICDVCGLWFIDNKSLCSGPQLLLQNTGYSVVRSRWSRWWHEETGGWHNRWQPPLELCVVQWPANGSGSLSGPSIISILSFRENKFDPLCGLLWSFDAPGWL